MSSKNFSLLLRLKDFFGIFFLTPFEEDLLDDLSLSLSEEERKVLSEQLNKFTKVRRLVKHIDAPGAHGFTNFYTDRFGRDVSVEKQKLRFESVSVEELLAETKVRFDTGEIMVQFWLVNGILFSVEYRSKQKIYYPTGDYVIGPMKVWPTRNCS